MPTLDFTKARPRDNAGVRRRVIGEYTGPAAYVAGGDPLTPGDVKLGTIELITFEVPKTAALANYFVSYDYTNQKVVWFDAASAEIAGGTNLSAYKARFEAIGY